MKNWLVVASAVLLLGGCTSDNANEGGPITGGPDPVGTAAVELVISNVLYGNDLAQQMDVYLPAGRTNATPVVFVLHGGGFVAGTRSDFSLQSRALMAKGLAVINLDYRLVDTTGLFSLPPLHRASSVRMTEQIADIGKAMDAVAHNAAEWRLRTSRWAVVGHSAGGTLALLYAYNFGGYNSDGRVTVAANWAGSTTLAYNDTSDFSAYDPRFKELYFRTVGAEVTNANRLAFMANSPFWLAFNGQATSTINIRPQFNVVFGLPDLSEAEYAALTNVLDSKSVPNKFVLVPGADHGFGQPGNWQTVIDETAKYIFAQQ